MYLVTCILPIVLTAVFSIPIQQSTQCNYKSCHPIKEDKINIHLVPHSHDDVGWLKTVDQYYYGNKDQIQRAGVQYIIGSTVNALKVNPDRRYIQVETAFFWKWWQNQNNSTRQDFIDLVNKGQLEMVNGAWSMNDEAATNYQSTIDQFTWGFRILNDTVGLCGQPKVGWQIDPFGHSREHVSILGQLGFDGIVVGRIDYRDKHQRLNTGNLNFLWQGSVNLKKSTLFGSMFHDIYSAPKGFCFDILCNEEPINDDTESPDFNLDKKVNEFARLITNYSKQSNTKNILVPMGDDFQYQSADMNFINMDRLIKGFKNHKTINVLYSTPSCYIKAVNEEVLKNSIKLQLKTDDFFPYASDPHAFWTGYFTSRPNSKRFERTGNNILQAAKQLASFSKISGKDYDSQLNDLRETMGIMQHHDAITGTEKQAVADDYVRRLTKSIKTAEGPIGVIISDLLKKEKNSEVDLKLSTCLLGNISICQPAKSTRFLITVYNPLSRNITHFVRLPVEDGTYSVTGPDGEEVNELYDSISDFNFIPNVAKSPKDLVFKAKDVPPLGLKVYYVKKLKSTSKAIGDDGKMYFGTKKTGFEIDSKTLKLKSIKMNGRKVYVTQEFLFYKGANGDNNVVDNNWDRRASGAYIFRPLQGTVHAEPITKFPITAKIQKGKLVDEIKQIINDEVSQIIRVYKEKDSNFIEFDWLVGNIQVNENDGIGKEIITRFKIEDFDNKGVFYTDSNGRELIKRQLNKRNDYIYNSTEEPIASNYYPITSKIVVKDNDKNLQIAILNDRPQGGSSLSKDTIELMVHRRLLNDDGFGVGEALNETEFGKGVHVRGQHYFVVGSSKSAAQERDLALKKLLSPWILVANVTTDDLSLDKLQQKINFKYSGLKNPLPKNVHILTLEPWKDDLFILRLEHILEKNEDPKLSQPVTVNLKDLFNNFEISDIRETTLGANQWLDDYEKQTKFKWDSKPTNEVVQSSESKDNLLEVILTPMQIRTFIIKIQQNKNRPITD